MYEKPASQVSRIAPRQLTKLLRDLLTFLKDLPSVDSGGNTIGYLSVHPEQVHTLLELFRQLGACQRAHKIGAAYVEFPDQDELFKGYYALSPQAYTLYLACLGCWCSGTPLAPLPESGADTGKGGSQATLNDSPERLQHLYKPKHALSKPDRQDIHMGLDRVFQMLGLDTQTLDAKAWIKSLDTQDTLPASSGQKNSQEDIDALIRAAEDGIRTYRTPRQKWLDGAASICTFLVAPLFGTLTTVGVYGCLLTLGVAVLGASAPWALPLLTAVFVMGMYVNYEVYAADIRRLFRELFDKGFPLFRMVDEKGKSMALSGKRKAGYLVSAMLALAVGVAGEGVFIYHVLLGILAAMAIGAAAPYLAGLLAGIAAVCTFALMFYAMASVLREPAILEALMKPFRAVRDLFDPDAEENVERSKYRLKIAKYTTYFILGLLLGLALVPMVALMLLTTLPGLRDILKSMGVPSSPADVLSWILNGMSCAGQLSFVVLTAVEAFGCWIARFVRRVIAPASNQSSCFSASDIFTWKNILPVLLITGGTLSITVNAAANGVVDFDSLPAGTSVLLGDTISFGAALDSAAAGTNAFWPERDAKQEEVTEQLHQSAVSRYRAATERIERCRLFQELPDTSALQSIPRQPASNDPKQLTTWAAVRMRNNIPRFSSCSYL